jgi:hypothetical protein
MMRWTVALPVLAAVVLAFTWERKLPAWRPCRGAHRRTAGIRTTLDLPLITGKGLYAAT